MQIKEKKPWWMCDLEWEDYVCHPERWELIHNGQQNPDRFEFNPEGVRFFTRRYFCRQEQLLRVIVYDWRRGSADIRLELHGNRAKRELFRITQRYENKGRAENYIMETK